MSTTTLDSRLAEARHQIDEHSLAAALAEDWPAFASAVDAELRSWDIYLERLQTSVAAKSWKAREQAEAAIGDVRSRRIEVDERLAQARDAAGSGSEDARKQITAARDELEREADELFAEIE